MAFLYSILPEYTKNSDVLTDTNIVGETKALEGFMNAIDAEIFSVLSDSIREILSFTSIEKIRDEYLPYFSYMLGYEWNYYLDLNLQKDILRNILEIYKRKGTRFSFHFGLYRLDPTIKLYEPYEDIFVLNKSKLNYYNNSYNLWDKIINNNYTKITPISTDAENGKILSAVSKVSDKITAIDSSNCNYSIYGKYIYKFDKVGNIVWYIEEKYDINNLKIKLVKQNEDIIIYTVYTGTTIIDYDEVHYNCKIVAINNNGDELWTKNVNGLSSIEIADDTVYVGTIFSSIYKYDIITGKIITTINDNIVSDYYRISNLYSYYGLVTNIMYDNKNQLLYVVLNGHTSDGNNTFLGSNSIINCYNNDYTSNKKSDIIYNLDFTNYETTINIHVNDLNIKSFDNLTVDRVGKSGKITFKLGENTDAINKKLYSNETNDVSFIYNDSYIKFNDDNSADIHLIFDEAPKRNIILHGYILSDYNLLWSYVYSYYDCNDYYLKITNIDFNKNLELFFSIDNSNLYKIDTSDFKNLKLVIDDKRYQYNQTNSVNGGKIISTNFNWRKYWDVPVLDSLSVKVYVNGVFMYEDIDYTIDYKTGIIKFKVLYTEKDSISLVFSTEHKAVALLDSNLNCQLSSDSHFVTVTYTVKTAIPENIIYFSSIIPDMSTCDSIEVLLNNKSLSFDSYYCNNRFIQFNNTLNIGDVIIINFSIPYVEYSVVKNDKNFVNNYSLKWKEVWPNVTKTYLDNYYTEYTIYVNDELYKENINYSFDDENELIIFKEPLKIDDFIKIHIKDSPFDNRFFYKNNYNGIHNEIYINNKNFNSLKNYFIELIIDNVILEENNDYTFSTSTGIITLRDHVDISRESTVDINIYNILNKVYSISSDHYSNNKLICVGGRYNLKIINTDGKSIYSIRTNDSVKSIYNDIDNTNFIYYIHDDDIVSKLYFITGNAQNLTSPDYYSNGIIVVKINKMLDEIFEILKTVRPGGWKLIVEGNYGVFYSFHDKTSKDFDSNGHYYYMDHYKDTMNDEYNGLDYRYNYINGYYKVERNPLKQIEENNYSNELKKQFFSAIQYSNRGIMNISMLGKTFIVDTDKSFAMEDLLNPFYEGKDILYYKTDTINSSIRDTYTMFRDPLQANTYYNEDYFVAETTDEHMDMEIQLPSYVTSIRVTIVGGGGGASSIKNINNNQNISVGGGGAQFTENVIIDIDSAHRGKTLILHSGHGGSLDTNGESSYIKFKGESDFLIYANGGFAPESFNENNNIYYGGAGCNGDVRDDITFIAGSNGADIYSNVWKESDRNENLTLNNIIPIYNSTDNDTNKGNSYYNKINTYYTAGGSSYHRGKGFDNTYDLHYGVGGCYNRNTLYTSYTDDTTIYVNDITVTANNEMYIGDNQKLNISITPFGATNKVLNIISSNTDILTINSSNVITGISEGTATISVYSTDGSNIKKTIDVLVKKHEILITDIYLSGLNEMDLITDTTITQQLSTSVLPINATNQSLTFNSSNTNVATVSNTGLVTAVAIGDTVITINSTDGSNKSDTLNIHVSIKQPSNITINEGSNISVNVGGTKQLTLTIEPTNKP